MSPQLRAHLKLANKDTPRVMNGMRPLRGQVFDSNLDPNLRIGVAVVTHATSCNYS